jgi:hypothetical protein
MPMQAIFKLACGRFSLIAQAMAAKIINPAIL